MSVPNPRDLVADLTHWAVASVGGVTAAAVRVSPELEAVARERMSDLRSGMTEASPPGALPREK